MVLFYYNLGFKANKRTNLYLNKEANTLTKEDLIKDILIHDEVQLSQINDLAEIDKFITIPIVEENYFLSEKLIDDLSGKDYKEVINQNLREWILKDSTDQDKKVKVGEIETVEDALKQFEEEEKKSKEQLEAIKSEKKAQEGIKKKKRTINGKLSETKPLLKIKKNIMDDEENIKHLKPINILKNKQLYKQLKENVLKGIRDDLINLKKEFSSEVGLAIINQIISAQENILNEKENEDKKDNKEYSSDNLISEANERGKKIIPTSKFAIKGDGFSSDAQNIINAVEEQNSKGYDISAFFTGQTKRISKITDNPEINWKVLGKKIRALSGALFLQTIGAIIKGIQVLINDMNGEKISLEERINLYQMLNENEIIAVSIFQKDEEDKNVSTTIMETKTMHYLIPSEHPEKFTFLQELERKIQVLNKLLDNNNLKPEDKKKLEQLKNLYFQQKNILK